MPKSTAVRIARCSASRRLGREADAVVFINRSVIFFIRIIQAQNSFTKSAGEEDSRVRIEKCDRRTCAACPPCAASARVARRPVGSVGSEGYPNHPNRNFQAGEASTVCTRLRSSRNRKGAPSFCKLVVRRTENSAIAANWRQKRKLSFNHYELISSPGSTK